MQAGQALVLFAFFFVVESRLASAVCVLLMAGFGFASVSPIQRLVMDKARAAGAPNLAASVNIGLFNLGNAIGTWLGGWVIAAGFGYAAPKLGWRHAVDVRAATGNRIRLAHRVSCRQA
ncbi:Major facilitator superfamily [Pseudomonas syringae pv. atrofaciens]|uniref:Major facilitator superfamily MFS_1 n=2 Tax=Pseudomonas syringae TaxID=317 RepID=F3FE11_PSESX|nr:MFS transporter [Pseudomonas syringae]EGH28447.1 major facilitator superfamily MFS_1 [Pseudomonas syringae pv. japonica str. M301072]RMP73520.1 Major facilitator superfamily [Pseudomonas syringae pv. atrofaciens]